jgi:hypothetical protein
VYGALVDEFDTFGDEELLFSSYVFTVGLPAKSAQGQV